MARDVIKFEINKPIEVALEFPAGKNIEGKFGPRTMFSCVGNRVMYLDLGPAQAVNELHLEPGETFYICKGAKHYDCCLSPATENKRAQSEIAPEPPESEIEKQLGDSLLLQAARKRAASAVLPATVATPRGNGTYGPVAAPAPAVRSMPTKRQYADAFALFLIDAGRVTRSAELVLAGEGGSARFDNRDIAAIATSMFIQAAKDGFVTWDGSK